MTSSDAPMIQLTDMILRVQYEAKDPTTLTTFLESVLLVGITWKMAV